MSDHSAIEFDAVNFSYDGPCVLKDVCFSIDSGDFVSIVGPNGGGKTTLLKLMLGLLKPSGGEIRVFGETPRLQCTQVGYTPQFLTVDFGFPLSVLDVVIMGRIRSGCMRTELSPFRLWYSREDRRAAMEALKTLQLEEYADVSFCKLSGGQRQRVLIARAVCGEPKILLLDEPTNNIDATSEQILSEILVRLNQKMTIALVSHDIGFVSKFVKKVICVNRTVAVHPTSEINGCTIHELYGQPGLKLVLHDHY